MTRFAVKKLGSRNVPAKIGVVVIGAGIPGLGATFAWEEEQTSSMGQPALQVREPLGVVAAFDQIKLGDPFDAASRMGPLAMERQRGQVEGFIAQGKADGARLSTGGGLPSHLNRGHFIEPTVFANVDNCSVIAREEIFGPVVSIIPTAGEQQAIEIANDSIYGLNAYAVGRQLRLGKSAIGREGGVEGLHPYLEARMMVFETAPKSAHSCNEVN